MVAAGIPVTSLVGNEGMCLHHFQKGTPQLSNSQTGLSAEVLTLLGSGRSNWPGQLSQPLPLIAVLRGNLSIQATLHQSSAGP